MTPQDKLDREGKWLIVIVIATGLLFLVLSLYSCSTAKDNKAAERVLGTPELLEKVGREWEKQNPCLPVTEIKPGKDSIRIDTVFNNDFFFGSDSVRIDSFETSIVKTVIKKVPVYITKSTFRVDTVPDLRRINLLERDKAFKDGQFLQEVAAKLEEKKEKRKWMWAFIVGFALYLGTRFIKTKPKWL